ncbi:MAG: hypothetical protein Q4F31_07330 [Eubacteriales bacterium]|nr:hypothetical protein [Eubacteriales bacterium]
MKKFILFLKCVLPHVVIILSLVLGTMLVLHQFNPRMGFLTNSISQKYLTVLLVSSFVLALLQAPHGSDK